jgi:hypothetical protein
MSSVAFKAAPNTSSGLESNACSTRFDGGRSSTTLVGADHAEARPPAVLIFQPAWLRICDDWRRRSPEGLEAVVTSGVGNGASQSADDRLVGRPPSQREHADHVFGIGCIDRLNPTKKLSFDNSRAKLGDLHLSLRRRHLGAVAARMPSVYWPPQFKGPLSPKVCETWPTALWHWAFCCFEFGQKGLQIANHKSIRLRIENFHAASGRHYQESGRMTDAVGGAP